MRLPSGVTISDEQRTKVRNALSTINLHLAGAGLLLLLCIYFGVRMVLLSGSTGLAGDEAIVAAQSRVAAAEMAAKPLRGVDTKLQVSDKDAEKFYTARLPFAYSDVASELGGLAKETNVRLSRASYVRAPSENGVTELRIDVSIVGEYKSVAMFINSLERNKSFFLIENVALSGTQGGLVNLQMRIGTWIREPMPTPATQANGAAS
jgi:hypothetical protein